MCFFHLYSLRKLTHLPWLTESSQLSSVNAQLIRPITHKKPVLIKALLTFSSDIAAHRALSLVGRLRADPDAWRAPSAMVASTGSVGPPYWHDTEAIRTFTVWEEEWRAWCDRGWEGDGRKRKEREENLEEGEVVEYRKNRSRRRDEMLHLDSLLRPFDSPQKFRRAASDPSNLLCPPPLTPITHRLSLHPSLR